MSAQSQTFLLWAPIYAEPIPGSGEWVVVAIAVADDATGKVFRLPADKAAKSWTLVATLNALEPWFVALDTSLAKMGSALFSESINTLENLRIGKPRKAVRKEFASVAKGGFVNTSVFDADTLTEYEAVPPSKNTEEKQEDAMALFRRLVSDPISAPSSKYGFTMRIGAQT